MNEQQAQLWITRPNGDGEQMAKLAREHAMVPWLMPVLDIFWLLPAHESLRALMQANVVIVTSRHALTSLDKAGVALPKEALFFAVGKATAQALLARGIEAIVPQVNDSEGLLAEAALTKVDGQQIVILKGEGGRTELASKLFHRGAVVVEVPLYRRICKSVEKGLLATFMQQRHAIVTAASAETLTCALKVVPAKSRAKLLRFPLVVMSERIARFAQEHGWQGEIKVATQASSLGLILAAKSCLLS